MVCTLPSGQGVSKPIVVNANGQESNTVVMNYANPVITSCSPQVETPGGMTLTINGNSFG